MAMLLLRSSAVVIQPNCTDLSRRFSSSNAQQLAFAVKRVANWQCNGLLFLLFDFLVMLSLFISQSLSALMLKLRRICGCFPIFLSVFVLFIVICSCSTTHMCVFSEHVNSNFSCRCCCSFTRKMRRIEKINNLK